MMHDDCESCFGGPDALQAREQESMAKYGFYVHLVMEDPNFYGINIHTHGLVQSFGHLDFQIVVWVPRDVAMHTMHTLVDHIRAGHCFKDGDRVPKIVKHFDLLLIEREESGRKVLRIVFPDRAGNVDEDKIDCQIAMQFSKEV